MTAAATLPLRHSSHANPLELSAYQLELEINQLARAIRSRQQLQDVEKRLDAIARRLGQVKPHSKYAELRQHFLALVAAVSLYFAAATASGVGVGESLHYQPLRVENVRQVSESSPKAIRDTIRTPSLGVRTQSVEQPVGIQQLMNAIIGQESGGKYHLVNPHSGALGFAQLMPENVRPWTREALGYSLTPDEFLQSPKLQIKTIQFKLNQYVQQQTAPGRTTEEVVRRVASLWYSGKAVRWNDSKPQFYNGHSYPSIAEYTKSVWEKYNRVGAVAPAVKNNTAQRVVDVAHRWVGKDFKKGVSARCADFMRHILKEAGITVPVSNQPIDRAVQWNGPHPLRAQSFFGTDVGQIIRDKSQLQPGDLVAWANTYGSFGRGAITHVGLYVGNGMVIDRSTSSAPIKKRSIDHFAHFVAGVRPYAYQ